MKDAALPIPGTAPAETHASRRLLIGLCAGAAFFYWMSLYLYVPTLPTYLESKIANLAIVGAILSMYGLAQAIVRLPVGIAVDWVGHRKLFIVAGLALSALGAVVLGTSDSSAGLFVGRSITGLAASTWVPLLVVFSGLFPPAEAVRASSLLTIAASLGRLFATSPTGFLNEWGGYAFPFFLAAGAAGIGVLGVLPIREHARLAGARAPGAILRLIVRKDVLGPALVSTVLQYGVYTTTYGFLPILAQQRGATDAMQSVLTSFQILIVILGNILSATMAKRLGGVTLAYATMGLTSAGLVACALADSLFLVFAAQFCMGMAYGVGYPVLMGMSIQHVDDSSRMTAMGLHQAVYAIGMFAGPWLSGMIANLTGLQPMFGGTALLTLVVGVHLVRRLAQE